MSIQYRKVQYSFVGIGGCDNGDQNTHVTLDIERSNDGVGDSVDIRCSANKTSLIYHIQNMYVTIETIK